MYLHDFMLNFYHTLKIQFCTCHIKPIYYFTNQANDLRNELGTVYNEKGICIENS